jgi:GMP synthase (glutamine-hydrolysing)
MSGKVLLIVHQETSDPGRVGAVLRALGYQLDVRRPALGDPLPACMDDHAAAVVFGGPMSANDDHLAFIRAEIDFIGRLVEAETPFLGICLGAQMLARAFGARVEAHPEGWHEIGYYRVAPTAAGRHLFPEPMLAYQWHGEGFELPRGAALLATGDYFPNQAFRCGASAYGIQFHPEVTRAMMQTWSRRAAHRLVLPGAQSREEQTRHWQAHDAALGAWLERFVTRWLPPQRAAAAVTRTGS